MSGFGEEAGVGGIADARAAFRVLLRERLREQPYPLFVFADGVIPAASVWTGARLWVEAFRAAGLCAGDRVLVALPPSAAWLQVFVAAVWEGLTLALVPPARDEILARLSEVLDTRAVVGATPAEATFAADPWNGARSLPDTLCVTRRAPTPALRLLLRTSGTESGDGRWVALTDANILSVAQSHLPHLGLAGAESRVLSVLPWTHAFGLVIDLLPALLSGAEIHRDLRDGRDAPALLARYAGEGITHLSAVPLTLKRIAAEPGGVAFLESLAGGVVGGATVDDLLATVLRNTRLRVGYGQTEAAPGIALGAPGVFPAAGYLGRALGCETAIAPTGTLLFRGANACAGFWTAERGLEPLPPNRWHDTGDIVRADDGASGDLFFLGRADAAFKLANGRRIEAEVLETAIRAALPDALNVFVFTRDGETLEVASDAALEGEGVRAALGAAGKLVSRVHRVGADVFVRTAKGTLRRAATDAAIRESLQG